MLHLARCWKGTATRIIRPGIWTLPLIEFAYHATPHSTTQTSPFIADLGYEPNLPTITTGQRVLAASGGAVDFVTKQKAILLWTRNLITEFQRDQEATANGQPQHREETYEVGECVLLNQGAYFTGRGEVLENTAFICWSIQNCEENWRQRLLVRLTSKCDFQCCPESAIIELATILVCYYGMYWIGFLIIKYITYYHMKLIHRRLYSDPWTTLFLSLKELFSFASLRSHPPPSRLV